jgi:hypothetical protein
LLQGDDLVGADPKFSKHLRTQAAVPPSCVGGSICPAQIVAPLALVGGVQG